MQSQYNANIASAGDAVSEYGTDAEKRAWSVAYNAGSEEYVARVREAITGGTGTYEHAYNYALSSADGYAAENYYDALEALAVELCRREGPR